MCQNLLGLSSHFKSHACASMLCPCCIPAPVHPCCIHAVSMQLPCTHPSVQPHPCIHATSVLHPCICAEPVHPSTHASVHPCCTCATSMHPLLHPFTHAALPPCLSHLCSKRTALETLKLRTEWHLGPQHSAQSLVSNWF